MLGDDSLQSLALLMQSIWLLKVSMMSTARWGVALVMG
jgi:hypothetical protein